jgi:hypothetical protein
VVGREGLVELGVGDLKVEPVAEALEIVEGHLLHLMGGVATLEM